MINRSELDFVTFTLARRNTTVNTIGFSSESNQSSPHLIMVFPADYIGHLLINAQMQYRVHSYAPDGPTENNVNAICCWFVMLPFIC